MGNWTAAATAIVNTCVRGGYDRSDCERKNPMPPFTLMQIREFETDLRNIVVGARNMRDERAAYKQLELSCKKQKHRGGVTGQSRRLNGSNSNRLSRHGATTRQQRKLVG
jgi:hypothetical protein